MNKRKPTKALMRPTGMKMPPDLFDRIERYVERLRATNPPYSVNRSAVIRSLLINALKVAEEKLDAEGREA
jgi:hypothetical protein